MLSFLLRLLRNKMNTFVVLTILSDVYSADVQENHHTTNLPQLQSETIMRFIGPNFARSDYHQNRLWNYLSTQQRHDNNPCTWRGITCTDGVMTTLIFLSTNHRRERDSESWTVNANWLPSTLRNVHLLSVYLTEAINLRKLPRELRYFRTYSILSLEDEPKAKRLDLRLLPQKLEEFFIVNGRIPATLVLIDLPPNMHLIYICSVWLQYAYVENSKLPKSLKRAVLSADFKKCKIRNVDSSELDKRVAGVDGNPKELSERCQLFSTQANEMYSQLNRRWLRD